ncbi:MAG: VOC family protein [Legionellales bacterium]|nr:VOC family protein [Legionellales bacterium]
MTTKDPRAPGALWVNPYLMSPDVSRSIDFYQRAFGFKLSESVKEEEGKVYHAELYYHDAFIMVGLEGQHDMPMSCPKTTGVPSPICLCVYVDDVDSFFKAAVAQGAEVVFEPSDMFWGDRACCLLDIDGYSWTFCKHIGESKAPPKC